MSDLLNRDPEDINYNLPEETELPEELEIEKEIDEEELEDELLDETELDAHPQG